jgi:hypothetical protein
MKAGHGGLVHETCEAPDGSFFYQWPNEDNNRHKAMDWDEDFGP